MDSTKRTSRPLARKGFDELSEDELQAIVEWGESTAYKALRKLIRSKAFHHLEKLMDKDIDESQLYELARRQGRYKEDGEILTLPAQCKKKLETLRKK